MRADVHSAKLSNNKINDNNHLNNDNSERDGHNTYGIDWNRFVSEPSQILITQFHGPKS